MMASLVNTRIKMIMVMLAVLIAFAALAGGVFAKGPPPGDIPAADGTINACYKTHKDDNEKKGQLRLVSDPSKCKTAKKAGEKNKETPIYWNQGPAGPPGPPDSYEWRITGNSGTSAGTNFLGTIDNQSLVLKTNGSEAIRIDTSGNVGIGTTSPNEQLEITGNFRLPATRATTGIIMSDGNRFIHSFGTNNFFAGIEAGNLSMTGTDNTGVGVNALVSNTSGFDNTATGRSALQSNTSGGSNTAVGKSSLFFNTTGHFNTAVGAGALSLNATGTFNTAIGRAADVGAENLINATAVGANAVVNASNKIRLGNTFVTVIEGQVAFTAVSDANLKENFLAVDGEETLEKISQMTVESWNYKGHDPIQFRHYGPTAQDFFAAFGDDGFGVVGTETTINSGDMAGILMISVQALEKRTARVAELEQLVQQQQGQLERMEERLARLED